MSNYYKILGVPVNATKEQIKRAYREKAKKYHPDVNHSIDSNIRFQLLSEAYQTLIRREKRRKYDVKLKYGVDTRLRKRSREHYKRYGTNYRQRPGTSFYYSIFRSKKIQKKDKKTIFIENTLFTTMLAIGALALFFSISDLLEGTVNSIKLGIQGLLFSLMFLILLIYGWYLYRKG